MNTSVIVSLIFMGVSAGLYLFQSVLSSVYYPVEPMMLLKSMGMSMPTMFLSAFMVEWLWKDGENWTHFQRVFYRVAVFTLMMMVVRTIMDLIWDNLLTDGSGGMNRIFEYFLNSFHYGVLSAALYYLVRILLVPDGNKGDDKFNNDVIDR